MMQHTKYQGPNLRLVFLDKKLFLSSKGLFSSMFVYLTDFILYFTDNTLFSYARLGLPGLNQY